MDNPRLVGDKFYLLYVRIELRFYLPWSMQNLVCTLVIPLWNYSPLPEAVVSRFSLKKVLLKSCARLSRSDLELPCRLVTNTNTQISKDTERVLSNMWRSLKDTKLIIHVILRVAYLNSSYYWVTYKATW